MFGLGSKTIVGLDVGSSSIKAVELKKKGGQIEVAHLGLEPLSSDIVVDSMNLGASVMNINIVKGTTPLFPRDVSVGGHQYTDSLQKELDLSFEDAEALKLGRKVGTVSEDAKQPILQQVTEIIVLEIQKTFDFFRASAAGEHIEKIYLAGGSSKVPGLVEALRQEFSMPVELLNPFQRVMPPTEGLGAELVEQNPGQMAVAVGLALRSFESL
jgi:type IV pilus assembly protein PilM